MRNHSECVRGFTLVELLVVISIIALLIALLLPALGEARTAAKSSVCKSQLRQLAIAMTSYLNDNQGLYPLYDHNSIANPPEPAGHSAWHQKLRDGGYFTGLDVVFCPESTHANSPPPGWTAEGVAFYWGRISYGMSAAVSIDYSDTSNWPFFPTSTTRQEKIRRPSQMIIVMDADYYHAPPRGEWYGSRYAYAFERSSATPGDDAQAWPRHRGSCSVWWADGHVSGIRAPDPAAPETLYTPGALTTLGGTPDYWSRD